jgi:hypothetical protein
MPQENDNTADKAYIREQIKKMLEYSDLRAKILILFMASSGIRLGAFVGGLSDDDYCINHFMIKEQVNYLLLM